MLPEVEEFLRVKKEADQELNMWHQNSRKDMPQRPRTPSWGATHEERVKHEQETGEYREAYRVWERQYHTEYRAANDKHNLAVRQAYAKLRSNTKDPVILWMLNNIDGYEGYIETVLPILPATREELENLASQHDWCSEFDGFMTEAIKAGVLPSPSEKWDASDLIDWVATEYDVLPRDIRRDIQSRVNEIVERALAETRTAKPKADVQVA